MKQITNIPFTCPGSRFKSTPCMLLGQKNELHLHPERSWKQHRDSMLLGIWDRYEENEQENKG